MPRKKERIFTFYASSSPVRSPLTQTCRSFCKTQWPDTCGMVHTQGSGSSLEQISAKSLAKDKILNILVSVAAVQLGYYSATAAIELCKT